MEAATTNGNKPKKNKGCFSKLLNLLFIVALIVGLYYGYLYINDKYINPGQKETTEETQSDETGAEDTDIEEATNDNKNGTTAEKGEVVNNGDAQEVEIIEIIEEPLERINFQKVGTVFPYKKVTLTAETSGIINNFNSSEGDLVKKDQKIGEISDSISTEIAQINYETALKNLEHAKDSLESTKDSVAQDTESAAIGVETATLNYNNTITAYNNLVAALEEQIRSTKLGIQAAEIGFQAAQENYYTSMSSSTVTLENTLYSSLGGVASSLSLIDNSLDTVEPLLYMEDVIEDYMSSSTFNNLEDDIEDSRDSYYDLLEEYEDARGSNNVNEIKNIIDDIVNLLESTEDVLYDSKYIIDDLLDEDGDNIDNISGTLSSMKSGINILIPSIDQSKGALMQSKSGIDTLLLNTQISPEGALTNLEASEVQVTSARQALAQAEANRHSQLDNAQNVINLAAKQLETAKTQLESIRAKGELQEIGAKTQVTNVESQVGIASANLGSTEISSPIDGVILNTFIEEGNYINPSQRIMTIADMSKVKVIVSLTTEELTFIKLGQIVIIEAPGSIKEEGRITKVLPTVDPVSKKVDVEIIITNEDSKFKSGMFTDVLFVDAQKESPSILVPFKSIIFEGGNTYIYCVENSKAVKKEVEIGQISGSKVEITSGIRKGSKVITTGAKLVSDGDYVSFD